MGIMLEKILLTFFMLSLITSCNVTEQEALNDRAQNAAAGVDESTFSYNSTSLVAVNSTTNIDLFPLGDFNGYSFSVSPSLPNGLSLRFTNGEISGTPLENLSTTEYIITATNGVSRRTASLILTVTDEPPKTIVYPSSTLSFNLYDSSISYRPALTGGAPSNIIEETTLPTGLVVNPLTGEISGTPLQKGSGRYEIVASNAAGSISTFINLIVRDATPVSLSYNNLAQDIDVGSPLTTMSPTIFPDPLEEIYSISPALPSGLSLNPITGEISGTPSDTTGIRSYTVTATTDSGSTSANISLNVQSPPTDVQYDASLTPQQIQTGVSITPIKLSNYSGGTPVSYSCTNCPAGLTINSSTGTISGATTDNGAITTATVTATHNATNVSGVTTPRTLTSSPITFNIVDDYPDSLGYQTSYQIYQDTPIGAGSIAPSPVNGQPDSYSISISPLNAAIPGLSFNPANGEISGTATSAVSPVTLTITSNNTDQTGSATGIQVDQTITINVGVLPPAMIGYNSGGAPSFYDPANDVYEFVDGVYQTMNPCFSDLVPASDCVGGVPTSYFITPALPKGISLNPATGEISGSPNEISPLKYYTIRGENSAGSFSQTIAISTDSKVAPQSLSYNDSDCSDITPGDNILTMTLGATTAETPCYSGSQGTFTITPSLPSGLSLNSSTGNISGIPIVSNNIGVNDSYTVTINNGLGSISTNITINIGDIKAPSGLTYTDQSNNTNIALTDGDILSTTNIIRVSDYETNPTLGGFISTYSLVAPGFTLSSDVYSLGTMNFNRISGEMSGVAQITNPGDISPAGIAMQVTPSNRLSDGSTGTGADANFNLVVKEKPPVITYNQNGFSTNEILITGGTSTTVTPTNSGGNIATLNGGAAFALGCTFTKVSSKNSSALDLNSGALNFNSSTCEINYTAASCFGNGDTINYNIDAKNSGTGLATGTITELTLNLYDTPDFTFQPDTNFPSEKILVLDGSLSSDSYSPSLATCHEGEFTLTDDRDLPVPFAFNSLTGTISSNQESILSRRDFTLEAKETNSGFEYSSREDIQVQANYIETRPGSDTNHLFNAQKFDLNNDGLQDIILRSKRCDDELCSVSEDGRLALFIQDPSNPGLLLGTGSTLPNLSNQKARAVIGVKQSSTKAGILYINNAGNQIFTQSTTNTESGSATYTALDSTGSKQFIIPAQSDIVSKVGVIAQNTAGNGISIFQFDITSNDLSTIAASSTSVVNALSGVTLTLDKVSYSDMSSSGVNSAFVGYSEGVDSKVCVLAFNGTNFNNSCSATLDIPNDGQVIEMKFANVTGDSLEDLIVLANNGVENRIYVYENKNSILTGLYSLSDDMNLASGSLFVNFDLADLNNDGQVDIISNDLDSGSGDIDGQTVYYHSGESSNYFATTNSTQFPGTLKYSKFSGNANDVEVFINGSDKFVFNCQIDNVTENLSSCGIIGKF